MHSYFPSTYATAFKATSHFSLVLADGHDSKLDTLASAKSVQDPELANSAKRAILTKHH